MKHRYTIYVMTFLLFVVALPLHAQRTFDSKKRKSSVSVPHAAMPLQQNQNLKPVRAAQQSFYSQTRNFKTLSLKQPHRILSRNDHALPSFIETKRDVNRSSILGRKDARAGSFDYLREIQSVTTISRVEDFVIDHIQTDEQGKSHVRLQQYYHQIPVYGSEVIVHLNAFGEGEAFNGKYAVIKEKIETTPKISGDQAIRKAKLEIASTLR